jgi:hypothetical protein
MLLLLSAHKCEACMLCIVAIAMSLRGAAVFYFMLFVMQCLVCWEIKSGRCDS